MHLGTTTIFPEPGIRLVEQLDRFLTQTLKLPKLADVRLALNVAACDSQMLVVAIGDGKTLPERRKQLAELAWSKDFIGYFAYANRVVLGLGAELEPPERIGQWPEEA